MNLGYFINIDAAKISGSLLLEYATMFHGLFHQYLLHAEIWLWFYPQSLTELLLRRCEEVEVCRVLIR